MRCEQCGAPTGRGGPRCRDCAAEGVPADVRVAAALAAFGGFATAFVGVGTFVGGTLPLFASPFVVGLGLAQGAVARGLWSAEYWAWGWGVTLYALIAVLALGAGPLAAGVTTAAAVASSAGLLAAYIYGRHPRFVPGDGPAAAGR